MWESQRVRSAVAKRQVQDLAGVSDTAQREVEPYFACQITVLCPFGLMYMTVRFIIASPS